ncbi:putative serine/threonine-protein kinase NAK [Dorcoceras hygrometricum]|uniref:Putative serine/threonine-protein kinase NAK n=1 Tax=Dorcoceras hygrometricum TaxID=472368 RepID=A0A2Z7A794_9LAMI|nr:putative serine/threonine-protein kinase NAK [Dorcoceras hygrometricum]
MVRVNESWVIEPCADYWKPLPRQVVCNEVLPQFSSVDTLPTVSEFFKLLKKIWAYVCLEFLLDKDNDVCLEAAEFFVSGTLLPVGSLNFCRALTVVAKPVQDSGFRQPTVTTWGWSQLCTAFIRYSLFNGLRSVAFSVSGSATVLVRPTLGVANIFDTSVQIDSVPFFSDTAFDSDVQMTDIQYSTSDSDSSSRSEKLDFLVNSPDDEETSTDQFDFLFTTPIVGHAPAPTQMSLPSPIDQISLPVATDVSASFAALWESISRLTANQTKDSSRLGDSHAEVLSKIKHLGNVLLNTLSEQDQAFRSMIKNIRQEAHNDADVFSMKLEAARTQNVILRTELADFRQEVKAQKAELFKEIDDRLATIRSEQLDFRAQAQENYNNLSTQLGFLVEYINRGGDAKKVEDTAFDSDIQMTDIQHSTSESDSSSHSETLYFLVNSPDDEETSTDQFDFIFTTPAVGHAPAPTQMSLPSPIDQISLPVATDVSASFAALWESISRLTANQTKDSSRLGDSHAEVLSKIKHLGNVLLNTLSEQDQAFRSMIKNIRQEAHNDADVFSMKLEAARTQNVIL